MEVELKFLVEDKLAQERVLKDRHLAEIKDNGSEEKLCLKATYMDTEDLDLCKKKMAFRVRLENGRPVATLKWGGAADNGLHVRDELNVCVSDDFIRNPVLDVFKGSEIYPQICDASSGKPLRAIMEIDCIREQISVDTGKSLSVVSLDIGQIVTEKGSAPINELEIELYSGDKEDMIELGRELAAKYNLKPENKSKFQRGLELLGIAE